MNTKNLSIARQYGALWGVVGILGLLTFAVYRLTPYAVETLRSELTIIQYLILVAWCGFMLLSEGYDGFQRRIAPRVIMRAKEIKTHGDLLSITLAPLYCFGYFRAPPRRMLISYTAILLIIIAVVIVHQLPQPWRGIIDCGVVLGLTYGICSIILQAVSHAHKTE